MKINRKTKTWALIAVVALGALYLLGKTGGA